MEVKVAPMETADSSPLAEAMNRLWARFLPEIEERVATLELAATSIRDGSLSPALREQAGAAAHKLAGTLGTFGLDEGTELAREAEMLYADDTPGSLMNIRPAAIAAQLRATLAKRK
jgi:HPt (histidine-containing phosphotransfer) domain-containing protein